MGMVLSWSLIVLLCLLSMSCVRGPAVEEGLSRGADLSVEAGEAFVWVTGSGAVDEYEDTLRDVYDDHRIFDFGGGSILAVLGISPAEAARRRVWFDRWAGWSYRVLRKEGGQGEWQDGVVRGFEEPIMLYGYPGHEIEEPLGQSRLPALWEFPSACLLTSLSLSPGAGSADSCSVEIEWWDGRRFVSPGWRSGYCFVVAVNSKVRRRTEMYLVSALRPELPSP